MRRLGFTLIELLVVIAIIAILAAIIFPVFMRAKANAYRSSDISNMNALRTALQLYRTDNGAYPPALLGYVTLYTSGPNAGNVMPANELNGALFPRRIDSLQVFRPSYNRSRPFETTTAVWPNKDPRPVGSTPILDNNGDGAVTNADDQQFARQAYDSATTVQRPDPADPTGSTLINSEYYKLSGYETAEIPTGSNTTRTELRYALHWTYWGLGVGGASLGSRLDDPRQLGYSEPPESTVVTWNSYFRDYGSGGVVPTNGKQDVVLFLGGNAKPYSSRDVYDRSWRVMP
jgi:prepilin-type N-terminal cleavage/methylation domain-containing protein